MVVVRGSLAKVLATGLLLAAPMVVTTGHAAPASCAGDTTVAINEYLTKQLAVSERKLTDAYRKALASQSEPKWRSLVTSSQRAWIASRDQDCRSIAAYQWKGGTGEGAAVTGCLVRKDDVRIKELDDMVSGG